LRVLNAAQLRSGGDPRFYRAARNRTAKVFVPCVSARAPELRRPRFSFLYDQLVKEPVTGRSSNGGERAPHPIQQLRPTDRTDQLRTLKFRRSIYRFNRFLPNRELPYINNPAASVKAFFLDFLCWDFESGRYRRVLMTLYNGRTGECNVKISRQTLLFFNLGKIFKEKAPHKLLRLLRAPLSANSFQCGAAFA